MEAARQVKQKGKENDLLDRIREDEAFAAVRGKLDSIVNPEAFVGRAPQQVDEFIGGTVEPLLDELDVTKPNTSLRV
jgi:adenylosuccinate lyase